MKRALEILGKEVCDAISIGGDWEFKRIGNKWHFTTSNNNSWMIIESPDAEKMLDASFIIPISKIVNIKPINKIVCLTGHVLNDTMFEIRLKELLK